MVRSRTTLYHAEGNGKTERFNRTLLRISPEHQKSRWNDSFNKVIHAYNCTRHEATGFSPYLPLCRRSPRLPIDQLFGTKPFSTTDYLAYVREWRRAMRKAYELATTRPHLSEMKERGTMINMFSRLELRLS